jgi:hypothetical protein
MRTKYVNLTSSAVLAAGECVVEGFYVNSTSSGVLKLYNHPSAATESNQVIGGFLTPAAGFHNLLGLTATAGLYVGVPSGTINVTFLLRSADN